MRHGCAVPPHDIPRPAQQRRAQRQARRQACIRRSGPCISKDDGRRDRQHVGLVSGQVQRDLRSATLQGANAAATLGQSAHPYKPYSWSAGMPAAIRPCGCCATPTMRLPRELWARGGLCPPLAPRAGPLAWATLSAAVLPRVAEPVCQPLTPRRTTWLVLRREAKRTEARRSSWPNSARSRPRSARHRPGAGLSHAGPSAAADAARSVAHARDHQYAGACDASPPGCMRTMKPSKRASPCPGARGPVEGHINRLKMLKRQMFGRRASICSAAVSCGPPRGQTQAPGQRAPVRPTQQPRLHSGTARLQRWACPPS